MTIQLPLAAHDAALAGTMLAMGEAARAASAGLCEGRAGEAHRRAEGDGGAHPRGRRRRSWPPTRRTWRRGRDKGLTGAMLDRLELTPARIEAMAQGVEEVADIARSRRRR